jgi:hypothetical protein
MSQDIVAKAKADLDARGVDLKGACGALKITNLVAWRLRPQYALLQKGGGNRAALLPDGSCLTGEQTGQPGYATDYLIDTQHGFVGYDCLGDGGGANAPQWAGPETDPGLVARNRQNARPPIDPSGYYATADPPPPLPPTDPASAVLEEIAHHLERFRVEQLDATRRIGDLQTRVEDLGKALAVLRAQVMAGLTGRFLGVNVTLKPPP